MIDVWQLKKILGEAVYLCGTASRARIWIAGVETVSNSWWTCSRSRGSKTKTGTGWFISIWRRCGGHIELVGFLWSKLCMYALAGVQKYARIYDSQFWTENAEMSGLWSSVLSNNAYETIPCRLTRTYPEPQKSQLCSRSRGSRTKTVTGWFISIWRRCCGHTELVGFLWSKLWYALAGVEKCARILDRQYWTKNVEMSGLWSLVLSNNAYETKPCRLTRTYPEPRKSQLANLRNLNWQTCSLWCR